MFRQPKRSAKGAGAAGLSPDMVRQAQELQTQLAQAQEDLKESTVEASAGGGVLSLVMSGEHKLRAVTVDPEVLDPEDPEMLQDLIIAAVNDAVDKLAAMQTERMSGLTAGLSLPDLS